MLTLEAKDCEIDYTVPGSITDFFRWWIRLLRMQGREFTARRGWK
jgi:hypothetical protein